MVHQLPLLSTFFLYFKIEQPKFDEIYNKYKALNKEGAHRGDRLLAEKGWKLDKKETSARIVYKEKIVFAFSRNWSNKYKYFKCMWNKYGEKVSYKEVYEFESELEYPEKGVTIVNRNIRSTVNKLKKALQQAGLSQIDIKTGKGFTLLINGHS